jgi:hypothetical protein
MAENGIIPSNQTQAADLANRIATAVLNLTRSAPDSVRLRFVQRPVPTLR